MSLRALIITSIVLMALVIGAAINAFNRKNPEYEKLQAFKRDMLPFAETLSNHHELNTEETEKKLAKIVAELERKGYDMSDFRKKFPETMDTLRYSGTTFH